MKTIAQLLWGVGRGQENQSEGRGDVGVGRLRPQQAGLAGRLVHRGRRRRDHAQCRRRQGDRAGGKEGTGSRHRGCRVRRFGAGCRCHRDDQQRQGRRSGLPVFGRSHWRQGQLRHPERPGVVVDPGTGEGLQERPGAARRYQDPLGRPECRGLARRRPQGVASLRPSSSAAPGSSSPRSTARPTSRRNSLPARR